MDKTRKGVIGEIGEIGLIDETFNRDDEARALLSCGKEHGRRYDESHKRARLNPEAASSADGHATEPQAYVATLGVHHLRSVRVQAFTPVPKARGRKGQTGESHATKRSSAINKLDQRSGFM
jgi:hypothetical protein